MRTSIVYTLISDETDYYYEQALISVYSLRLYNPKAMVYIIVDQDTFKTLSGKRKEIYNYVSSIIPIDVPSDYNKMQRSRYLKTNLRKFINGDYLFIDCDTVICQSLEEVDTLDCELGLVADLNGELLLKDTNTIEKCRNAGFINCNNQPYYNSGVMYVKDTPLTHQFYFEWNKNWLTSKQNGVHFDQPALCQTNIDLNHPIKEISGIWNCQFKFEGYHFLSDAKIMHYYFNGSEKYKLVQHHIFNIVKEKGCIDLITNKILNYPQTIFYTFASMNEERYYEYTSSYLIYVYYNIPSLFLFMEIISKFLTKPIILISKLKNKIKNLIQ